MFRFDTKSKPPAAYVDVQITHPETGTSQTMPAKLDTGAARTVIPASVADALNLEIMGKILAQGFDKSPDWYRVYYVALEVAGVHLPMVEAIATARKDVLLGRDVLNRFIITLNGKDLTFEMKDP